MECRRHHNGALAVQIAVRYRANSTFTYKGNAVDIKQVGRELGVRYVLEGSVRKAGGKLRITGQLMSRYGAICGLIGLTDPWMTS